MESQAEASIRMSGGAFKSRNTDAWNDTETSAVHGSWCWIYVTGCGDDGRVKAKEGAQQHGAIVLQSTSSRKIHQVWMKACSNADSLVEQCIAIQ